MLLSRALNRGYASARARWPMEFGLLHQDCLWVLDEVQLMDVGFATSAQLQVFRAAEADRSFRPANSWWMSATLQRDWFRASPDTEPLAAGLPETRIPGSGRTGPLWEDVSKACETVPLERRTAARRLAEIVSEKHRENGRGALGPTLVVLNTVDRAVDLAAALERDRSLRGTELRLVHSRFRPAERATWAAEFLDRAACGPGTDRIVVATQVVEGGVDISSALLVTELAPWASLVQRFGRCARWGGAGKVYVVDAAPQKDEEAAPYTKAELDAARRALAEVPDVAPLGLERFEEENPDRLPELYPFEPAHLLLRHELDELFDTTPDLTGADIDVSRFIRSGDERDVHVFWAPVEDAQPPEELRPILEALCAVPFLKARDWLCGKETQKSRRPRLLPGMRAWVWDWLDGAWRGAERRDLYFGQTVLVDAACGGYDPRRGWSEKAKEAVVPVSLPAPAAAERTDAGQDDESLSASPWQTVAVHGRETGRSLRGIAAAVAPAWSDLLDLAWRGQPEGPGPARGLSQVGGPDALRAAALREGARPQHARGPDLRRTGLARSAGTAGGAGAGPGSGAASASAPLPALAPPWPLRADRLGLPRRTRLRRARAGALVPRLRQPLRTRGLCGDHGRERDLKPEKEMLEVG
jgi:CRISPR-associated endonuclease/helicase Cas3